MLITHTIALDLNNKQVTSFKQACGVARFFYNWALAEWKRQYEAHKADPSLPKPSEAALRRQQLNAIKREQFPRMLAVTKNAPQMAIIQLGEAFKNFFAGRARYPQFRKKGKDDRFTLTNDQVRIDDCRMRIPNLGRVRMRQSLHFASTIMSATISRVTNRWFVSITVDADNPPNRPAENQGVVGVDVDVSAMATLSTGENIAGTKPHTALLKRLRILSRSLSRKQKGSANWCKAKAKLARLHARIANIRQDAWHKLASDRTRWFHTIVIENLNVRGTLKNRHLARAIADMRFFEFRRQLDYKAAMRGGQVVVADRFFTGSKTCLACGHKIEDLPLSVRRWTRPECGTIHDRNIDAAITLKNLATQRPPTASSAGSDACGEEGSGGHRKMAVKPSSMNREVSFEPA